MRKAHMKKGKKGRMEEKGSKECSAVLCSAVQGDHYTAFEKELNGSAAVGRVDPRFVFVVSWYL